MKKLLPLPWQSADALLYAYRTSFKSTRPTEYSGGCFFMLFAPVAHDAGEIGLLWICIKLCSSRMRTNDFAIYGGACSSLENSIFPQIQIYLLVGVSVIQSASWLHNDVLLSCS